jgi:hypothetical protein
MNGVQRTTMPKAPTKTAPAATDIQAIREDLRRACEAAKTAGHPMRHVVLAHFADRILALAADHEALTKSRKPVN